jgi:hypothetical protein
MVYLYWVFIWCLSFRVKYILSICHGYLLWFLLNSCELHTKLLCKFFSFKFKKKIVPSEPFWFAHHKRKSWNFGHSPNRSLHSKYKLIEVLPWAYTHTHTHTHTYDNMIWEFNVWTKVMGVDVNTLGTWWEHNWEFDMNNNGKRNWWELGGYASTYLGTFKIPTPEMQLNWTSWVQAGSPCWPKNWNFIPIVFVTHFCLH